jgi:competence protein ComEC
MIYIAISFIAGIIAYNFFLFFSVTISILCIAITAFLFFRYQGQRDKLFSIIIVFIAGFIYSHLRYVDLPELILPDHELNVQGDIIDTPEESNGKIRFTIDGVTLQGERLEGKVRLFLPVEDRNDELAEQLLAPGNRINAVAILKTPYTFRNPGVYSYDLKKYGIVAVGYIRYIQFINKGEGLKAWIYKNRQKLSRIIDNSLSAENASFHKAIILGLKRGISQQMRDAFSATGLAHLLSISGTHLGLLALIIFLSIRTIIKYLPARALVGMSLYISPTQIAVLLTLPVLVLYTLISGSNIPTLRALIMIFVYMSALFLGRKGQWLNSLSIAAVIILLWQPDALFELSFLLSFIAVLFIGYVVEKKERFETQDSEPVQTSLITKIIQRIKIVTLVTIAAVIGTAPLVATYFHQFPLVAPVTNLLVTPLVCFIILPFGLITCFIALILNLSAIPLSNVIDTVTYFILKIIKAFSGIPYANFHVHNPSFITIVLYFLTLAFMFKSRYRWRALPFLIVLFFYLIHPYFLDNNLKVTFLDAGQGDAAVVRLPDGKVMVIDGSTHDPDMGRRVIAPYLWSNGIHKIDYVVSTHPHPDHYGGLIYIMDNFDVSEVWLNGRITPGSKDFFQRIIDNNIFYRVLSRGDVLEAGKYRIYILHPYNGFYADSPRGDYSDQNSDSLVLKVQSHGVSILFTGDIEVEAEENLVYLGKWLVSDIVKVPHHGSKTSNSKRFIESVRPKIAVISVGQHNPFNHPHKEVLERYRNAGVEIFRTDIDGAVTITVKDDSYRVEKYGDKIFRRVTGYLDEVDNLKLLIPRL